MIDWFDLLADQWTLKRLLQHHSSKASVLQHSAFFMGQLSHPYMTTGKTIVVVVLVTQSCPTLCDPIDCSLPGFSVHEILQARILVCTKSLQSYLTLCDSMDCIPPGSSVLGILEWVTMPFSRGSSWPRDRTQVSWFVTVWATREAQFLAHRSYKTKQQSRLVLQAIVLQPLL